MQKPAPGACGPPALGRTWLAVTRRQNLHQRRQASAQARDTVRNQVGHAVGVVRTGPEALRQVDRMIVHLPEELANQGTRVLGMKRAVQLQGVQQLLPDRVVVRMAPGAQAGFVQRLGPSVKSAEQWPPIDNVRLRGSTTPSDAAAVERRPDCSPPRRMTERPWPAVIRVFSDVAPTRQGVLPVAPGRISVKIRPTPCHAPACGRPADRHSARRMRSVEQDGQSAARSLRRRSAH